MNHEIDRLQSMVDDSSRIVFFGGAGVSVASGIPDFRSDDGLYSHQYDHQPETILSRTFFEKRPREFFAFHFDRVVHPAARPNPAHTALARWEDDGRLAAIVTQNIDGLHQMAGSRRVWELHGSIHHNTCRNCGRVYDLAAASRAHERSDDGIPRCDCGGIMEPNVVLYEDRLDERVLSGAIRDIAAADMLLVGGTSLVVYPAAGLIDCFTGDKIAVITKDGSVSRGDALVIHAPIEDVLPLIRLDSRLD
jgi:NAD-dependent deacetylase